MADTVQADIEKAWGDHVGALTTSPATDIAYPNVSFKPANNKPYLELRYFPATTVTNTYGNDEPKIYSGTVQITVVSKSGKGSDESAKLAGQVVDHFKMGTRVTEGSLASHVPRQPSINAAFQEKSKLLTPVLIPYRTVI